MPASVAMSGGFYFPNPISLTTQPVTFGSTLIDSANESASTVFTIRQSGTISKMGFRTMTVSTGAEVDIRLETVGADGNPSGTLYQDSSNVLLTITDVQDTTWFTVTLGSGTVVQVGSVLAARVTMSATSAGNLSVATIGNFHVYGYPYADNFQGGVWVRTTTPTAFGLEYSDGSYPFTEGIAPFSATSFAAITTATTTDER